MSVIDGGSRTKVVIRSEKRRDYLFDVMMVVMKRNRKKNSMKATKRCHKNTFLQTKPTNLISQFVNKNPFFTYVSLKNKLHVQTFV